MFPLASIWNRAPPMPHAADDATTGVPQAVDGNVFGAMHARSAVTMNPVWIPNTFGHALIAATTHMWHAVLTHRIPAVTHPRVWHAPYSAIRK